MVTGAINIDGIYYLLDADTKTAKVTSSSDLYKGDINVPQYIVYSGETYNVICIGKDAFSNCSSLTSIKLPNGLVNIEAMAFERCSCLTELLIPNSVKSIGFGAFLECNSLKSIILPQITIIEPCTLEKCSSLKHVNIPNTVKCIREMAFSDCCSISDIFIPESVIDISNDAFMGCSNLSSINVEKNNTQYNSNNECNAIIETTSNRLLVGCKNTIIPQDIKTIGPCAFANQIHLSSIEIPKEVTKIEQSAFAGCTNLTHIILPECINEIEDNCFAFCESLKSIELPTTLTHISPCCFYNCITLNSVQFNDSITSIGHSAFMGCKALSNIDLPKHLTYIGSNAFNNCSSLESIVIPKSVTNIELCVFSGCSSLESIKVIDNNRYDDKCCNAIIENSSNTLIVGCKNTIIPNDVKRIAPRAFSGHSISSVEIPNNVQEIMDYAFADCLNISSIVLPDSIICIGNKVFCGCQNLNTITLPQSVRTIGKDVFKECQALKSIYISHNTIEEYCKLGLEDYRHLISPIIDRDTQLSSIVYATMSIAGYCVMKGCTPQEIKSARVQMITNSSGISRPALVISNECKSSSIILFANKKYSIKTVKELENWITVHQKMGIRVAYSTGDSFLCLRDDEKNHVTESNNDIQQEKIGVNKDSINTTPVSNNSNIKDSNVGYVVISAIGAIVLLILTIAKTDEDNFAMIGATAMFAITAIAGYFIYKRIQDSSESKGCLPAIIGFISFIILFNVIGYNYEINTGIGILIFVIISVIAFIYIIKAMNKNIKK